ncbi:MAG: amino acid permease [Euryarchaeota archaeon]|jgi:amino acid transporter|nr:amino acid permease [Euryarchaeota archaeon]MBT3971765.1 amino acid permease [Euryarchaeota archaeon]MBT4407225.1 amino acid permease [Euryarchaeota archaeon]
MTPTSPKDLVGIVLQPIEMVSETLERKLGLFSVIIISLSAMIGSGLFVLPSLAYAMVGGGVWLAYILAAMVVIPGALSQSELASAMPTSGGSYVFVERTFGPLFGTMTGLGLWASFLLKAAFALIGFSAYLMILQEWWGSDFSALASALGMLILIALVNILGMKKIKVVQTPIVTLSIFMLIALTFWAIINGDVDYSRASVDLHGTDDWMLMGEAAAFVLVSYAGVAKVAAIGEEVKNPGRNLPGGIMTSLAIGAILYAVLVATMVAVIPHESFFDSSGHAIEDPVRVFAEIIGGSTIGLIAAAIAVLTMTSMALAGILAASRYLYAMSRDNLLPEFLEDVHGKFETPHWAIIVTAGAMAIALVTIDVHAVAEYASGFQIMVYVLMCLCVLILRKATPSHAWYEPEYNAPFRPATQLFGVFAGLCLLFFMGKEALFGGGAAIMIGGFIFFSYGKKHYQPKITPWETFKLMFINADEAERRRRITAFHAADREGNNHLNLHEFIAAMDALGCCTEGHDALREYFHAADENADGVLDIDEFLKLIEQNSENDN